MFKMRKIISMAMAISMIFTIGISAISPEKISPAALSADAGKQVACDVNVVTSKGVTVTTIFVDIPNDATKDEANSLILREAENVVVPQRVTKSIQLLNAANGDILFAQDVIHFGSIDDPNEVARFNLEGREYSWVSVTMSNVSPIVQSIRCYINSAVDGWNAYCDANVSNSRCSVVFIEKEPTDGDDAPPFFPYDDMFFKVGAIGNAISNGYADIIIKGYI